MSARWEETQRERSSLFMLLWLIYIARFLGRGIARLILIPVVAYFLVTGGATRRASENYLRRILGRAPRLPEIARHFHTFAGCALDRLLLMAGKARGIELKMNYTERAWEIRNSGKGCLMFSAHIGSLEAIRAKGALEQHLPLRVVMDRQHGRMYTTLLERMRPEMAGFVLDAADRGPTLVLRMKQSLDEGKIVVMMADRSRDGEPMVDVEFLGSRTQLPASPWIMAGTLGVPVLMGIVIYRDGHYEGYLEEFADRITLTRGQRMEAAQKYAQQFAQRMEHFLRKAPYNWFNYYDFWPHDTAPH